MSSEVEITDNRVQITRVFDAPRPLVFAYWTQADKLQQWSRCKDATRCEVQSDFRVGGSFSQMMEIKGTQSFTVKGTYDEIVEPERVAYHADMGFGITNVTIEFIELGAQTRVILTHEGLPNEFICRMVSQGTAESFDFLDEMLTAAQAATVA